MAGHAHPTGSMGFLHLLTLMLSAGEAANGLKSEYSCDICNLILSVHGADKSLGGGRGAGRVSGHHTSRTLGTDGCQQQHAAAKQGVL